MVSLLLSAGANVHARTKHHRTTPIASTVDGWSITAHTRLLRRLSTETLLDIFELLLHAGAQLDNVAMTESETRPDPRVPDTGRRPRGVEARARTGDSPCHLPGNRYYIGHQDTYTDTQGFAAAFYHLLAFLSSGYMMSVLSGVQTGKTHACQCCGSVSRESPLVPTPS